MRPFHFGRSDKPLFGIHHSPDAASARPEAVVICYPFGPEYLYAHRALRELAHRLAGAGLHVLRFDYYGTGDSAGTAEEGTIEQWLDDIRLACEEAKEIGGARRVSVLGLRLGATLAALSGSRGNDIARAVLWDPVVVGRNHLADLAERHVGVMAMQPRPRDYKPEDPPIEVMGTPLSDALRAGIGGVDLMALEHPPAARVAVMSNEADPSAQALCDHLRRCGAAVEHEPQSGPPAWGEDEKAFVPRATLATITSCLSR